MKLTLCLALLIFLAACSESSPDKLSGEEGTSSHVESEPALGDHEKESVGTSRDPEIVEMPVNLIEEPSEGAISLEASILSATRTLTKKQIAQNEQTSIDELEDLSEADRESLSNESAIKTANAAEQKAEQQAVSAALRSID